MLNNNRFHRSISSLPKLVCSLALLSVAVFCLLAFTVATDASSLPAGNQVRNASVIRWYKGNLHTHTLWSDADDYPEMVVEWYKTNGYHFLALSDHNILSQGQKWIDITHKRAGEASFNKYLARFGAEWVEKRIVDCNEQVRLKPLNEFRCFFEEPGRFLLIQAEEITQKRAHVNAINLKYLIPEQSGDTALEVMQKCIDAVLTQRQQTGRLMFPHINHPNFKWAIAAEVLMQLQGEKFFEVYNGHPKVRNYGDQHHTSTDRMWDIILTKRLAELKLPIMYGIATDDAHRYHAFDPNKANPGRGWVVVRAHHLTPESIIKAMESGDFYASTGVVLKDIAFDGRTLKIQIEPEKNISYTTQFIGTLKGYDPTNKPVTDPNGLKLDVTRIYSSDIGRVLAEVKGATADYDLTGEEIYVRARIISTKPKTNPFAAGDVEVAWVQPVVTNSK